MKRLSLVSIVIPVYNEERYILPILKKVLNSNTLSAKREIIIVDDGSTDRTQEKIAQFTKKISKSVAVTTLRNSMNHGKGYAVRKGLLQSHGEVVIIQDADLEYDPNDYARLLAPFLLQNANAVYGSRFIAHKPKTLLHNFHYQANSFLTSLSNFFTHLHLSDMETGYKAFEGVLIRSIVPRLKADRFGFEPEVTARLARVKGIALYEVPISYSGRSYEEGKKIRWFDGLLTVWEIIFYNLFEK